MPVIGLNRRPVAGRGSLWLFGLALLLGCSSLLAAEPAGEVLYAHGITSVQRTGEGPRFVAKGDALQEGDVISTSATGFALIGLKDGTKMTLRPNTTFAIDKFRHGAGEEAALFRLLRGGLRALTGLVGKRNPQGMNVNTLTATIGVRGTAFDARLCGEECAGEKGKAALKTAPSPDLIVGRAVEFAGSATVVGPGGQSRLLTRGTPLFTGDSVRTEKGAYAVLAFRDQTKVTVVSESEFKLENVRFSGVQADSGDFVVRVVRGGMRALTGFLAKRAPQAVKFNALAATIGIRGTGLDTRLGIDCVGQQCAQAALVYTWEGAVAVEIGQRSLVIERDRAGVFNPTADRLTLLDAIPRIFLDEIAPRPDAIKVDFNNLFGVQRMDRYVPGLYVGTRDGHVEFAASAGAIDLGPGEAGYLAPDGNVPIRLSEFPSFLLNDPYPAPEDFDERTIRLLELLYPGVTPGGEICEVR